MRILVYPHDLGLGGSQLNAIEIAAGVAALGHNVTIFGRPGALNERIEQLGLEFVESPSPGRRPSPGIVAALATLVDERRIDILHGYEWPPALETVLASRRSRSVRAMATVMSMSVPPFIPRTVPLLVGTAEIAAAERSAGRRRVAVLEPPVDVVFNSSGLDLDVAGFRRRWHLDARRMTVVSVTRFAHELKLEGTLAAMEAVGRLTQDLPTRLVLVGDGAAREEVEAKARVTEKRSSTRARPNSPRFFRRCSSLSTSHRMSTSNSGPSAAERPTPYQPVQRKPGNESGASSRQNPRSPCTTNGFSKASARSADPPMPSETSAAA